MKMLVMKTNLNEKFNLENAKLFEHANVEFIENNSHDFDDAYRAEGPIVGVLIGIITPDEAIKLDKYNPIEGDYTCNILSPVFGVEWEKDKFPLADGAIPIGYFDGFVFFDQKSEDETTDVKDVIAIHVSLFNDFAINPIAVFDDEED